MFKNLARVLAATAAIGLAMGASACKEGTFTINGEKGVPLSELDMSGPAPTEVAMLGPDEVHLRKGDKLAIAVEGDEAAKDALRFTLKDGTLGIARQNWKMDGGHATITVTMPPPAKLVMAGSGKMSSEALAGENTEVTVAGSGDVDTGVIETTALKIDVAGSGSIRGSGRAKSLRLTVAGSGNADLDGLSVDDAKVDVAGSGKTRFASDGTVKADIMGSGEVRVRGRATCKVSTMGSGQLVCESGPAQADDTNEAPEAEASDEG